MATIFSHGPTIAGTNDDDFLQGYNAPSAPGDFGASQLITGFPFSDWPSYGIVGTVLVTYTEAKTPPADGNDSLLGGFGDDTLLGGGGNDTLIGGAASFFGNNDIMYGGWGDDVLIAGNGAQTTDNGSDYLNGGPGQDVLNGMDGNDVLDGGDGTDVAIFHLPSSSYIIKAVGDKFSVTDTTTGEVDLVSNVEYGFFNTPSAPNATQAQALLEAFLNDPTSDTDVVPFSFLFTKDADDVNFHSLTQEEIDLVKAAPGAIYDALDGDDVVKLPDENEYQLADGVVWQPSTPFHGGIGDDQVDGGDGSDTVSGDGGDDVLAGGKAHDVLQGGDDADTLYAGENTLKASGSLKPDTSDNSVDQLDGGANEDVLFSWSKAQPGDLDILDGGDGVDKYFVDGDAVRYKKPAGDLIKKWEPSEQVVLLGDHDPAQAVATTFNDGTVVRFLSNGVPTGGFETSNRIETHRLLAIKSAQVAGTPAVEVTLRSDPVAEDLAAATKIFDTVRTVVCLSKPWLEVIVSTLVFAKLGKKIVDAGFEKISGHAADPTGGWLSIIDGTRDVSDFTVTERDLAREWIKSGLSAIISTALGKGASAAGLLDTFMCPEPASSTVAEIGKIILSPIKWTGKVTDVSQAIIETIYIGAVLNLEAESKKILDNAPDSLKTIIEPGVHKFGDGNLIIDDGTKPLTEDEGTDGPDLVITPLSSITLPENIENVVLLPKSFAATSAAGFTSLTAAAFDAVVTGNDLANVITGNEENNVINSGAGPDSVYGLEGNDIVDAGAGDDEIMGGRGDDSIDGAGDFDTAVYAGPAANFAWTYDPASKVWTIVNNGMGNIEGTDTLANVEALRFSDKTVVLPLDTGATSIAVQPDLVAHPEGDLGTTAYSFTVTRSGDTSGVSGASWSVAGSGTHPTDAADFGGSLPSGSVSFAAGETTKTITVNVAGDTGFENDEGFTLSLTSPTGATITTGTATGTITNDDSAPAAPTLALSPASIAHPEGDLGTTAYSFTVTRS
ncbi:hypothetical protein, partial [Mesorhizobium sp.]|uniref:Calx-beta domain-containing protein n=1 Tax=Mesorhizobium sp. TaxID=1871066 RepID=UPI0011FC1CA5